MRSRFLVLSVFEGQHFWGANSRRIFGALSGLSCIKPVVEEVSCRSLSWPPTPASVSVASVSHQEACVARPQLPRSEVGIANQHILGGCGWL
jgi:hypothetical protein